MDVQMSITSSAGTKTSASGGKTAAGSSSAGAFTQVLDGQLVQGSQADSTNPTDPAVALAGLLQMLQSLIMPVQNVAQSPNEQSETLPETLVQAMNSNPGLAQQLLQDPKMKQWFEQVEQILGALTENQAGKTASLPAASGGQAVSSVNLQAQNTLLTLATLTKQQPDNPILQYVNQQLQDVIQPILPAIVAGQQPQLKAQQAAAQQPAVAEAAASEEAPAVPVAPLHAQNKRTAAKHAEVKPASKEETVQTVQTAKSKLELLAVKNAMIAPIFQAKTETDDSADALQPLPTEAEEHANPFINLADVQKSQFGTAPAEKLVTQTLHSANFAEEMTDHVMKNMKITLAEGISEAKLSLFPKNLGHVDVKITMHEGQLIAQFAADTAAGRQMLESQLPQLRQALQSQGLQVEKLEVTQSPGMQSGMFQDQRQQQSPNQTFRQNKNRSGNYEQDAVDFNQEIASTGQTRTTVYGNSFDVIA